MTLHEAISDTKIATIIESDGEEKKKSCRLMRTSRFGSEIGFVHISSRLNLMARMECAIKLTLRSYMLLLDPVTRFSSRENKKKSFEFPLQTLCALFFLILLRCCFSFVIKVAGILFHLSSGALIIFAQSKCFFFLLFSNR